MEDGVRADVGLLFGLQEMGDCDYRIEVAWVNAVGLENFRGELALERGKAEAVVPIGEQEKAYRSVAEAADAVVED